MAYLMHQGPREAVFGSRACGSKDGRRGVHPDQTSKCLKGRMRRMFVRLGKRCHCLIVSIITSTPWREMPVCIGTGPLGVRILSTMTLEWNA